MLVLFLNISKTVTADDLSSLQAPRRSFVGMTNHVVVFFSRLSTSCLRIADLHVETMNPVRYTGELARLKEA